MARSDAILERLHKLHPDVIDLSLDRIERLLADLGNPERALRHVVHVAGTNGKGSVIAYMRAALEAAGLAVHTYTSPHLVRFHERIRLGLPGGGRLITESELTSTLEECEAVNGGAPITFFEITTAAAFLFFSRHPADVTLLETGLGGRLDATNVLARPALTAITAIDLDHQEYLGGTVEEIAAEKAAIMKRGVPCIVGPQTDAVREVIELAAARINAPLIVHGQDWHAHEERGRLVYQDTSGLLDLPLPKLAGRFQIGNAGMAVAALRTLGAPGVGEGDIERGLLDADWPARFSRLTEGDIADAAPDDAEIWLDGGHNPSAAEVLAAAVADLEDRVPRPLVLVMGMLRTKNPAGFLRPFAGLAQKIVTLTIPGDAEAFSAEDLRQIAEEEGFAAEAAPSLEAALAATSVDARVPPRILICGSLALAGHVLSESEPA